MIEKQGVFFMRDSLFFNILKHQTLPFLKNSSNVDNFQGQIWFGKQGIILIKDSLRDFSQQSNNKERPMQG